MMTARTAGPTQSPGPTTALPSSGEGSRITPFTMTIHYKGQQHPIKCLEKQGIISTDKLRWWSSITVNEGEKTLTIAFI